LGDILPRRKNPLASIDERLTAVEKDVRWLRESTNRIEKRLGRIESWMWGLLVAIIAAILAAVFG